MEAHTDRRNLIKLAGGVVAAGVAATAAGDLFGADAAHAATKPTPKPKPKPKPAPVPPTFVATLSVPKIALSKPVFAGIEDASLNVGVGHGSWTPAPGQPGHCMIFGHRTSHGGPFRKLHLLVPGDTITVAGVTYTVQRTDVLPITNKPAIWGYPGTGSRLSLVACSKPNGQPTSLKWRICVRAQA